jgi:tetratricopeptide (TPR) repeat protein
MTAMDEAAVFEAEAADFPEEAGEILLEAAAAWRRAGRAERATEILLGLVAAGGDDGCYARLELVEVYFDQGADTEAYDQLAHLARDSAAHDGHCALAAELLVERGDLVAASEWYDRALARLRAEDLEALRGPNGWMQMAWATLRGRREVRKQLGLPTDATDEAIPVAPLQQPVDVDELNTHLAEGGTRPREVRMLVFQRDERAEARRTWPDEYEATDEEYYPAAERRWRELADAGVPKITVVPAKAAGLAAFATRVGGSATDSTVKVRYTEMINPSQTIVWPPPRNSPCWCGSGTKYKKCCGRPT